jgi:hypothetical protein
MHRIEGNPSLGRLLELVASRLREAPAPAGPAIAENPRETSSSISSLLRSEGGRINFLSPYLLISVPSGPAVEEPTRKGQENLPFSYLAWAIPATPTECRRV